MIALYLNFMCIIVLPISNTNRIKFVLVNYWGSAFQWTMSSLLKTTMRIHLAFIGSNNKRMYACVCNWSISLSSLFLSCWSQQIWNAWLFYHTFSIQLTMMIHSHRNYCFDEIEIADSSWTILYTVIWFRGLMKSFERRNIASICSILFSLDVICCFLRILLWSLFHVIRK